MQAWGVETRQPHVADDDDVEGVFGVSESVGERFAPPLVADVALPFGRVGRRAGHDRFQRAAGVVLRAPFRAQGGYLVVQRHAYSPAHAHNHRLAALRRGFAAALDVFHDVARNHFQTLGSARDRLQLRPLRLEALFALYLFAFGGFFEIRIHARALGFVQGELRQAAFVVDGNGRAVLHRAAYVVNAYVIAERRAGVGVFQLYRRAGESDERRAGQGVAHVARETVYEVVLAAMRLVRYHCDVAAGGQRFGARAGRRAFGKELLDCGEYDAAGLDGQFVSQIRAARRLNGRLAQKPATARERAEKLVVQIVAVGEDYDRRVLHRRLLDYRAGVERHSEAFAGALGAPRHAHAPVAGFAARIASRRAALRALGDALAAARDAGDAQRFVHRRPDRVKPVIARHLLGRRAAAVFVNDEVADERQEAPALADALQRNAQLRRFGRRDGIAFDSSPRLEPLPAGGERPKPRFDAVRYDKRFVGGEQVGDVRFVSLELPPRAPNVRARVGGDGAFQLGDRERQAVHEQDEIGSARAAVLGNYELVDGEPVVGVRVVEIDRPRRRAANAAAAVSILHADAFDEHLVKRAVARLERRAFGTGQLSERVPKRVRRQIGVEPRERVP